MVRLKEETQAAHQHIQRCKAEQDQSRERTTNLKAMLVVKSGQVLKLQDENTKELMYKDKQVRAECDRVENEVTKMQANERTMKDNIERLKQELEHYSKEIGYNASSQTVLDQRCATMTNELQVMLDHPMIPEQYKMTVDATEGAQLDTIAKLEEHIREYYEQIDDAQSNRQRLDNDTHGVLTQRDAARQAAATCEAQVAAEMAELRKLAHKKQSIREKINSLPIRKVVKEVVNEVVIEKFPEAPFSNEFIMEKCFDEVDTAVQGYAHTHELISRVRTLSSFDSSLVSLLGAVEDIDSVKVDRDDFIELVLLWRKHGYTKRSSQVITNKSSGSGKSARDELLIYFDEADDQGLGFAEKNCLADYLESAAAHREVSMLGRLIRAHPADVVERAEYETILMRWRRGETVTGFGSPVGSPERMHDSIEIELEVKAPKVQCVELEVKIKAPEVKVKAPGFGIEVKVPSFGFSAKVKAPAVEIEVKAPKVQCVELEVKIKAPEVKVKAPGFGIEVKVPSFGFSAKVKAPAVEIEVKAPEVHASVEVSVHAEVSVSGSLSDEDLLAVFDHADADCTGFAPVARLIEELASRHCAGLIEMLEKLDTMILEREDFEALCGKWRGTLGGTEYSDEDLLIEFDKVDEEETGFVPRLDLRLHLENNLLPNMPQIASLIELIKNLDTMILEKDDFEELIEEWRAH